MNGTAVAELERVAEGIECLNLGEFAKVVGSTEPTVRKRVNDAEPGPWLIERGSRGQDYKIHPVLGPQWWRGEEERRRAAEAVRGEKVEQLALHFIGEHGLPDEGAGLTASERIKLVELQRLLRIEGLERGDLIKRDEMERLIGRALTLFTKRILRDAKSIARDADLAPAQRSEWEEMVEAALNAAIDECQELLRHDA